MPPVPPRRTIRDLLVPRDVTETARQGQGIGDLAAIRQAATMAGKEFVSNLPYISEGVAAKDFGEAARRNDKLGMALAAASVLPMGHIIGKAGKYIAPAIKEAGGAVLDEALRVARGEQYFPHEVWHSTGSTVPFEEFIPMAGRQWHDLPGTHVGTRKAAQQRAAGKFGIESWDKPLSQKRFEDMGEAAPSVMPLRMRMHNPFLNPEGNAYSESELRDMVRSFAEKEGYMQSPKKKYDFPGLRPENPNYWEQMATAQEAFAQKLKDAGHDVIPYVNQAEDIGKESYLVLEPNRLRSRFAQFDPAKLNSRNLSAGLAGILTGGAALRSANNREQ
jgi:hypothetical protein